MTTPHTARAHATLAPSAAHRWMHCPGSIRMSEGIPNTTSVFAAEGTACHELCSHCLETGDHPGTFEGMWVDIYVEDGAPKFVSLDEPPSDPMRFFEVTEEMVDAVSDYVEHVRSLISDPELDLLSVEQRLDMTHIHSQIYGTGDATVMQTAKRHLHVIDMKYGRGVAVDADDNPQLLLYAAGAARRHHNHKIERLTMHIAQPRADHRHGPVRSFEIDLLDLFEFEADIEKAARATEAPDAPLAAGDWCRFCPALSICRTAREKALSDLAGEFVDIEALEFKEPDLMTGEELARVLRAAEAAGNWINAVQSYAHAEATAGRMPPGFKLVAKRAYRKWKDAEAAEEHLLVSGVSKDEIFAEPKIRTPAQLERYFPGKNKEQRQAAMSDLVKKESSGTNLVVVSDPRPAVRIDATEEFGAIEAE